jgi:hypothetical protein
VQLQRALDGTRAKTGCFLANDALYRFGDAALRRYVSGRFQKRCCTGRCSSRRDSTPLDKSSAIHQILLFPASRALKICTPNPAGNHSWSGLVGSPISMSALPRSPTQ